MAYSDLNNTHNPQTGNVAPAAWGDQIRDNFEFLIDPPSCSVFNSAAQSVANSTVTILTANSENFDNNAMHSTVTNTSRITAQTAGRYLISSTIQFASNATGVRGADFLISGTTVVAGSGIPGGGGATLAITTVRYATLTVGAYVEARCIQTSGGNLDVTLQDFTAVFLTR